MNDPDQPTDTSGRQAQQAEPAAPGPLQLARWLWIASTVLGVVRSMVQLSDRPRLISELRKAAPQLTQDQIDDAANSGVLFALILSGLILALYVVLSNRMLQGRRWARNVMVALSGISVFGTMFTLITVAAVGMRQTVELTGGVRVDALDIVFTAVILLLDAAVLVLLFHRDSNRFFTAARTPRRGADGA